MKVGRPDLKGAELHPMGPGFYMGWVVRLPILEP